MTSANAEQPPAEIQETLLVQQELNDIEQPREQKQEFKQQRQFRPYFIYSLTFVQVAVFLYTLFLNNQLTGQYFEPISTNIMLGPSSLTLISAGARFVPCMKPSAQVPISVPINCPIKTSDSGICTLEQVCGLGGFNGGDPNQWFRFITPIFLHGGILHLIFNLWFQFTTGADLERDLGMIKVGIVYFGAGITGFVLGAIFTSEQIPSVGASGSLFGLIALLLIDLCQNYKYVGNFKWELAKMVIFLTITFLVGLIPQIDNFAHLGGFIAGILIGLTLMPIMQHSNLHKYAQLAIRFIWAPLAGILLIVLITQFYSGQTKCEWCLLLDCIPTLFDCNQVVKPQAF